MDFDNYKPNIIESMFFRCFHIKPYVYEPTFTLYEQMGQVLEKINENVANVNSVGEALVVFEEYVKNELSTYDAKIVTEVNTMLQQYITNGTIANLINQTLFGQINSAITNLQNDVTHNKTDSDNKFLQIDQEITDINYRQGTSTLSISPNQLVYNNGESINGVMLNLTIVKGTDNPTQLKYYKNGILVSTKSTGVTLNESYLDGNIITNDVEYYAEVLDGKTVIQSNKISVKFINNFYSGVVDSNATINETLVKSLSGIKTIKSDIVNTYSPNDQKIIFSYPAIYGDLSSIEDINGYNLINAFNVSNLNLTLNGVITLYKIFTTNDTVLDSNLHLEFKF